MIELRKGEGMRGLKYKLVAGMLVLLTVVVAILPVGIVKADDDDVTTAMFVSPMLQEIILAPGEKYEGTISISNGVVAKQDLVYNVEVGSYNRMRGDEGIDDYEVISVESRTGRNAMMDWITVSENSGTIAPNGKADILYTINVPEDAPAGAQYASILITDNTVVDNPNAGGIAIKSVPRIVSAIVANVAGETVEKGRISENNIPAFLTNGAFEASSMVQNEGNVYTNATYILTVSPIFSGEEICTNEEEPASSLVLPETERYHTETCDLPMLGIFRAKQTVKVFGETSVVERTILVCPVWLMLLIILAVVAIIVWLVVRARGRKKAAKGEAEC